MAKYKSGDKVDQPNALRGQPGKTKSRRRVSSNLSKADTALGAPAAKRGLKKADRKNTNKAKKSITEATAGHRG
ncbi:MAG: hypothetical protein AAGA22_04180, partial [Pseudomonadota bacterium]